MTARQRVLVIGAGNEWRGDDAAGVVVARRLGRRPVPNVDVIEAPGDSGGLIDAWRGHQALILIDAMRSSSPPGAVHRLDVSAEGVPARFGLHSTHAAGVAEAIEIARALRRLPSKAVVYGIEGARYEAGAALSPAVEAAVPEVIEAVKREARAITEALEAAANA